MKNLCNVIFSCLFVSLASLHADDSSLPIPIQQICSPTECYTIIKKLGEGAFGEVYSVENSKGEHYALKSYKIVNDFGTEDHFYTDLEREFSRGQLFDHPNIIKSYEHFISLNDVPTSNLILQLVNGQTLSDTPKRSLTQLKAKNATLDLIGALNYALSLGMMHLDLHGRNIMLNEEYEIMVIDLASFFTIDELIDGYQAHKSKKEKSALKDTPTTTLIEANSLLSSISKPHQIGLSVREKKLQKFFNENPKFLQLMEKVAISVSSDSVNQQMYANIDSDDSSSIEQLKYSEREKYRLSVCQGYFNVISEACIKVISASNLNRDEKINLRAEIKKIAWNCEADFEENCSYPIGYYFETLTKLLQTEL